MTVAFGPHWHSPQTDRATWIDTPVGEPCLHCGEPIAAGDQGLMQAVLTHANYDVQPPEYTLEDRPAHGGCSAAGIIGHTLDVCACTGWEPGRKTTGDEVWRRLGHAPGPRGGKPHAA